MKTARYIAPSADCALHVVETDTRDAIKDADGRTIAYVAIGAESFGPLLAAAPEMAEALGEDAAGRPFADLLDQVAQYLRDAGGGGPMEECLRLKATQIRAALAKAGLA